MRITNKLFLMIVGIAFLMPSTMVYAELLNKSVSGSKPSIRVMTYNVAAGAKGFDVNLDKTAAAILSISPDIIGLQEIDNNTERSGKVDQIKYLAEKTGYNYVYGKALDFDGGEYGIAVMSKHKIISYEVQMLPSEDREQRVALYTMVEVEGFEVPITYINTHLDWHGDPKVRLGQVYGLLEKSREMTGIKILGGDFNDVQGSDVLSTLELYWNNVYPKTNPRTWPATNPKIGIDHIFTDNAQRWNAKPFIPKDTKNVLWHKVSDHYPVVVDLVLTEY